MQPPHPLYCSSNESLRLHVIDDVLHPALGDDRRSDGAAYHRDVEQFLNRPALSSMPSCIRLAAGSRKPNPGLVAPARGRL